MAEIVEVEGNNYMSFFIRKKTTKNKGQIFSGFNRRTQIPFHSLVNGRRQKKVHSKFKGGKMVSGMLRRMV